MVQADQQNRALLSNLLNIFETAPALEKRLQYIAGFLSESLDLDFCCIYLCRSDDRSLRLEASVGQGLTPPLNAGQAVLEGGEVSLGGSRGSAMDGEYVEISISDTGAGIPPEIIGNIFNPFFTTKGTGTGLGLAIAHRAVLMHSGEIKVDNRPGEGITFTLSIPVHPPEHPGQQNVKEEET